jgi:hypothetical protein
MGSSEVLVFIKSQMSALLKSLAFGTLARDSVAVGNPMSFDSKMDKWMIRSLA